MTLPSAELTFPTALSRNADSWFSIPEFLDASHVSSIDPDDLMQDVPSLAFFNDPIESGTWFTPNFVHGLHATQLEPGQDSCQAITPVQPPLNRMSSLNDKANSKSNACTTATNTSLSGATNRVKGSARIEKTKKYSGASASAIRKRARERKAHLFQAFAPLEKAKKTLKSYSKSSRHFRQKSESLFLQLEKLIDEAVYSDDASDSSSMLEASDLEADSAYGSFSDMPLLDVSSSVFEEQDVYLGRQATAPSSIQNSELHSDEETPRQVQPLSPTYSCTYGPGDEQCPYATSRKSDWIRHEESEKHWPQKRYMCMLCAEPQSDGDLNPCCTYCSLAFSTIEKVHSHSLNCVEARRKGKTFTGAKTDHFQAHLVDVHHRLGLDKTSAAWTYNHKTKWPRYCGFCTYHFKDWEERKHHVAEHFKKGANISDWKPLLHNPRRKATDEPALSPRNDNDDDDDDDDDDDNLHQHGRGRYSTYEATQSASSTTTSNSSGSFDLSNNSYLNWDNNNGGWCQYNLEYEECRSKPPTSCVNRLRKNRQGMRRKNPGYDAYDNEFISDSCSISDEALSTEPTNTVSTAFQGVETYQTSTAHIVGLATILKCHLMESTTAPETINDVYVGREDGSYHKISLENMGIESEPSQVTLNPQRNRSPREYFHSSAHPDCSRKLGQSSEWHQKCLKVHAKGDRKPRLECGWKRCPEPFTGKDNFSDLWISAQRQYFKDHLKPHYQRVVKLLLSGTNNSRFDNPSKLDPRILAKVWKLRRVFTASYSGLLHQSPEKYEDESLTSSDTISWGDEGNYIFDPSNRFLNNKQTCGPGQLLQEHSSEYTRDQIYRAMGHSCKREPDCPNHQRFEERRLLWPIFELWECGRTSEEQLTWVIEPNFKPFGITSDRPRYRTANSGFPRSVALERYLSDYDLSEHLAYLVSRHAGGDENSALNRPMDSPCFTSSGATLSLCRSSKRYGSVCSNSLEN